MNDAPKKLLMLGGSPQQVIAIEKARSLGYKTILCDYLPDNPGRHVADVFYEISTTDKEAVLRIAQNESIDGVIAYASDPAAPTAAFISDALNLPGMKYDIARCFCEKHLFRSFLKDNGFNVPESAFLNLDNDSSLSTLSSLRLPLIIKPTDSSGSKGVTVVHKTSELIDAIEKAAAFSRNSIVIVEEFIQRDHPHVIEAELLVTNGKIVSWGLINSIRDNNVNELLPSGYSYPLLLSRSRIELVKTEIEKLVKASKMEHGAFNIEMIINKNDELFFLDAGPRCGGNMLPDFISMIAREDLIKTAVQISMGETTQNSFFLPAEPNGTFWGLSVIHSDRRGFFNNLSYSEKAHKHLKEERLLIDQGQEVHPFNTCSDLLGLSFFKFDSEEEMRSIMEHYDKNVFLDLKDAQ